MTLRTSPTLLGLANLTSAIRLAAVDLEVHGDLLLEGVVDVSGNAFYFGTNGSVPGFTSEFSLGPVPGGAPGSPLAAILRSKTSLAPARKPAAYPAWRFQREVIPPKDATQASTTYPGDYPPAADYAVLPQGQLKHLATAAFDELQPHLSGGAGPAVTELVKGWYVLEVDALHLDTQGRHVALASPQTNDFAPVTH